LGVPHLFKSPHRTRYSMRLRTERANKPGAQSVRCAVYDDRPARLAQLVQHRLEWHGQLGRRFHDRLHCRFHRPLYYSLARPLHWTRSASRTPCPCRSHVSALPCRLSNPQPGTAIAFFAYLGAFAADCAPSGSNFVLAAGCFREKKPAAENCCYLRRCEIMRSVRLLCLVFLPRVGKAHGVTG